MKNKLMLTALLGLLLVGSFAYAEESDDEAKKRLLKEYEKVLKKNAENTQIQLDLFLSNLKTTEEAIKQINLAEEIVKFYKEKEIKFSNEIDAIHNIIGKN